MLVDTACLCTLSFVRVSVALNIVLYKMYTVYNFKLDYCLVIRERFNSELRGCTLKREYSVIKSMIYERFNDRFILATNLSRFLII